MKHMLTMYLAALCLFGCATPYSSTGLSGGYSETQLDENAFEVYFSGNGFTTEERATDFCLLRCAELTTMHGFEYFAVVDRDAKQSISYHSTPTTTTTKETTTVHGNRETTRSKSTTTGGDTYTISKPTNRNTIVCYKEKPDLNGMVYNARFLQQSLKLKYGMK